MELEKEEVNPINNITNMNIRQQDEEVIIISMIMITNMIIINIELT